MPLSCCHAPYGSLAPARCRYYCLPHKTVMRSYGCLTYAVVLFTHRSRPPVAFLLSRSTVHMFWACSLAAHTLWPFPLDAALLTCCCPAHLLCPTYLLLSYLHAAVLFTCCGTAYLRLPCSHTAGLLTCCGTAYLRLSCSHAAGPACMLLSCSHAADPAHMPLTLLTCCCPAHLL